MRSPAAHQTSPSGAAIVVALLCLLISGCVSLSPLDREALYFDDPAQPEKQAQFRVANWREPDTPPEAWIQVSLLAENGRTALQRKPEAAELLRPDSYQGIPRDATVVRLLYEGPQDSSFEPFVIEWLKRPQDLVVIQERRSTLHVVTYPFWGLPRDLVDAPWTLLRRIGFDEPAGPHTNNPAGVITIVVSGLGGGAVALAVVYGVITTVAAFPFPVSTFIAGMFVGGAVGLGATFLVDPAGSFLSETVQVPLLRGGVDSEDYFPNWKFLANRVVVEPASDECSWTAIDFEEFH